MLRNCLHCQITLLVGILENQGIDLARREKRQQAQILITPNNVYPPASFRSTVQSIECPGRSRRTECDNHVHVRVAIEKTLHLLFCLLPIKTAETFFRDFCMGLFSKAR